MAILVPKAIKRSETLILFLVHLFSNPKRFMLKLKKYCVFTVFLLFMGVHSYAQDANGWRIDSISVERSNAPQWKIDSLNVIGARSDAGKVRWSVDSLRYLPSPPEKIYEENDYIPFEQKKMSDHISFNLAGMGAFSDGDYAPFWLTNNQHGLGSAETNKGYLRLKTSVQKNIHSSGNHFSLSGGVDVLAANNLSSDFYIQQLYADLAYKALVFSVGMKEKNSLFKNKELSSGGLTLSNNARPIPQIELGMPAFASIPGTNDKIYVMGGLAYGWFLDDDFKRHNAANMSYAEKVLYHRKYGFIKFRPNDVWSFITGLEMDTQWGGHFYDKGNLKYKGSAKLKDFFKVLVPMSGGSESNITDRQNIVGNVYGSLHLIARYNKPQYSVKAYHEHFFEDHSGLVFKNIPDGLYGLEINLKNVNWLSDIVLEYLHTKDQSGPFLWDKNEEIPTQVSGGDNYYNHVDYISTSYFGSVLGNPFFTSPLYNNGQSLTVYNTRLSAFHLGIGGAISNNLKYRALFSYSRSWGTPLIPSVNIRDQFSCMFEATYNSHDLNGWLVSGAIGYDKSQMVGDNTGVQLKVSRAFYIPVK